jgi:hypothetical protein
MPHKTVEVAIHREGSMCFVPVNFDPQAVFGKIRAPVKVTLNGYTYRSTIASMGGVTGIPLRKSNREAAGLVGGERIAVTIELDAEPREVEPPARSSAGAALRQAKDEEVAIAQLHEPARDVGGDRKCQETGHAGTQVGRDPAVSG